MDSADRSAQPQSNEAYETNQNPASKVPAEEQNARQHNTNASRIVEQRTPSQQPTSIDEATPTSMARGIRGTTEDEKSTDPNREDGCQGQELEPEQMAAPGEGKVQKAVSQHPGASGKEPGLETDLARKKAEQAPLREVPQEKSGSDVDVNGILAQRSATGKPSDK
ncbi:hypothetical protein M433DRAFT_478568 [Acidomyces richmondensis BFW]|nr:MAG: hypothetical protein FE78DRAFT_341153 [Acidomyces sp. 'richmondensis']KYG47725.1 hypothetical protein M433DRAFT_478568 [Acidomyces richmondensis BFW]